MRFIFIITLLILSIWPVHGWAGPSIVLDLANDRVDITTGFDGAPLYVHGYIDDGNIDDLDVVLVVKGPARDTIIRRKEQTLGMWMNRNYVEFDNVYSFYDFAANAPLNEIGNPQLLQERSIGLDYLNFTAKDGEDDDAAIRTFHEALIRTQQSRGAYALSPQEIIFISDRFFRTTFQMPPDVPTGDYTVEGYLFDDDELVDQVELSLKVAQVGVNAEIFQFAKQRAFLYGLSAIFLALILGWSAHSFLRAD